MMGYDLQRACRESDLVKFFGACHQSDRTLLSARYAAARNLLDLRFGGPLTLAYAQALGHSYEIGQRIGPHLAHDVPAMRLYRELSQTPPAKRVA
jgi:hypothetical protein